MLLPTHPMRTPTSHRLFPWTIFLLSALTTIGLFFIPAFIIRPFSHQRLGGLAVALAIRQRAPWGTLATALVCALFAFLLWQSSTRWRKVAISFIMVLVAFSTVMARLNYFEWMFHPVKDPQFETEAASKLDPAEMILAVNFKPDARAYPIREMAYHHILNDVVGGVPIAVTY